MRELADGLWMLSGRPRNAINVYLLAALRPRLTCFGHGSPLRDPGRLTDFLERLPS